MAEPVSGGDTPEIGGFASSVIAGTNSRAKGHLDAAEMGLTREPVQSKGQHFRKLQALPHHSSWGRVEKKGDEEGQAITWAHKAPSKLEAGRGQGQYMGGRHWSQD